MSAPEISLVPGRSCAGCTMCCKLMAVVELSKPDGRWCSHCEIGKGCKIYVERPASCRDFYCVYLENPTLQEHWKPSHSRMVVTRQPFRINVAVDPQRPDAWRKEPYYADLKKWAVTFARQETTIVVGVGGKLTVVLPDRDVPIGRYQPDKVLKLVTRHGPSGAQYDIEILDAPAGAAPHLK